MAGGQASSDEKGRKRKGKKERMKVKVALGQPSEGVLEAPGDDDQSIPAGDSTSLRKRKREGYEGIVQAGTAGEPEPQKKKKKKTSGN